MNRPLKKPRKKPAPQSKKSIMPKRVRRDGKPLNESPSSLISTSLLRQFGARFQETAREVLRVSEQEFSPTNDDSLISQFYADFVKTAHNLVALPTAEPQHSDCFGLCLVMSACIRRLHALSKVGGGEEAMIAVACLVAGIRLGCEKLADAGTHEESLWVLKQRASMEPDWPVMLSLRESSYQGAKKHLRDIGVGTACTPPTANSKISSDSTWTQLAARLIEKIRFLRTALEVSDRKTHSAVNKPPWETHPAHLLALQTYLAEARTWKQVSSLPKVLNIETSNVWWPVARSMLTAQWDNNPEEMNKLFESVKRSAQAEGKTPKSYATRAVKRAFNAIAKQGTQVTHSIPSA